MPNRTAQRIEFGWVGRRVIEANFEGGDLSSDGGLMLLRRVDERIGLTRAVAAMYDRVPTRALFDPTFVGYACKMTAR